MRNTKKLLLLYINGQLADLEPGEVIAQTRQVNDLNSLDDRQASYTNKFKLPKTSTNLKIMQFLTVPGNKSGIPYQKNECSLYSDSGECFVHKGWAVITDGGDTFEAVIYDGVIDLYKAIENKNLSYLTLDEADHEKTVANVAGAMYSPAAGYPPYTYIMADYNGKTGNTPETPDMVNIDYLVPSINVKYLCDKIFTRFGITARGSVFDMESFKDLWLTFPKGITTTDNDIEMFYGNEYVFFNVHPSLPWRSFWLRWAEADPNILVPTLDYRHLKVPQAGKYRLEISGTLLATAPVWLCMGKNAELYSDSISVPIDNILYALQPGIPVSVTTVIDLNANESICLFLRQSYQSFLFQEGVTMEVKLVKTEPNTISFGQALDGMSIKDFLTEVVHRFGLTIFKDKHSDTYHFLTLQEQLQTATVADWSSKFCRKTAEKYVYGSYAQRNWFRYAYNDKEASHNDHYIDVANVNLAESRDVIKSKIYSPEKDIVTFLGRPTRLYKLWDKDPVDSPGPGEEPFKYKSLDKRYYFIKRDFVTGQQPITLHSPALNQTATTGSYNIESFYKLGFGAIIQDYYGPVKRVLNNALLVTAELYLTEADIATFDFRKLYYIEQLSAYFIINKITNYIPGRPVRCELVRVQNTDDSETSQPVITITAISSVAAGTQDSVTLTFEANYATGSTLVQYKPAASDTWLTFGSAAASPVTVTSAFMQGPYNFRIYDMDNDIPSNTEHILL